MAIQKIDFVKPKRAIDRVFIHCSASSNPDHGSVDVIRKWHLQRGFSDIGYHYFIPFNGRLQKGRDLEKTPAAQKGHNTGTIAICLHGLLPGNFTLNQFDTLQRLCKQISSEYDDNVTFHGHCEVSTKECPVFDYAGILELGPDGHLGKLDPATFLEIFDRGMDVWHLQNRLNDFLKTQDPNFKIQADGIFGQQTQQAVLFFQMAMGLTPDGIANAETLMMLPTIEEE